MAQLTVLFFTFYILFYNFTQFIIIIVIMLNNVIYIDLQIIKNWSYIFNTDCTG